MIAAMGSILRGRGDNLDDTETVEVSDAEHRHHGRNVRSANVRSVHPNRPRTAVRCQEQLFGLAPGGRHIDLDRTDVCPNTRAVLPFKHHRSVRLGGPSHRRQPQ